MKDAFPLARLVIYCEYYYALEGQDVGFDPEIPPLSFSERCRLRLKNTTNLQSLQIADAAISPTEWQKSTYPQWAQAKISVIHDGIDLSVYQPPAKPILTLAANPYRGQISLKAGDEVLSFVSRNLEPVRGFQMLMRTLPGVLRQRPKAHAIVVGGNDLSYGHAAPAGLSWKDHLLAEVGDQLDLTRVHFVGKVPYPTYRNILAISHVHAYWTTPFVLSWSFLEAALSGLPVVASNTAPVQEFAPRLGVGTQGFFDIDGFGQALTSALAKSKRPAPPASLPELDTKHCVAAQKHLLQTL